MGLLDGLVGQAINGIGAQQAGGRAGVSNPVMMALLTMLASRSSGGGGGALRQLADAFRQRGLGQQFDSWVGTGPNQAISGNEVAQVLGGGEMDTLAEQFGMPSEQVYDQIAQKLPDVVNDLTPSGEIPDDNTLNDRLGDLLRQFSR